MLMAYSTKLTAITTCDLPFQGPSLILLKTRGTPETMRSLTSLFTRISFMPYHAFGHPSESPCTPPCDWVFGSFLFLTFQRSCMFISHRYIVTDPSEVKDRFLRTRPKIRGSMLNRFITTHYAVILLTWYNINYYGYAAILKIGEPVGISDIILSLEWIYPLSLTRWSQRGHLQRKTVAVVVNLGKPVSEKKEKL
jgi:hypothetical protein